MFLVSHSLPLRERIYAGVRIWVGVNGAIRAVSILSRLMSFMQMFWNLTLDLSGKLSLIVTSLSVGGHILLPSQLPNPSLHEHKIRDSFSQ